MNVQSCLAIAVLALVGLGGCGGTSQPLDQPVKATGKVVGGDGKPVGDVTLQLQPLESGFLKTVDVGADGTFSVETQPGKYAYYFAPKSGAKVAPASVSKYTEANMERTVVVAAGQPIEIKLP